MLTGRHQHTRPSWQVKAIPKEKLVPNTTISKPIALAVAALASVTSCGTWPTQRRWKTS
jgi:hypothetical protein